MKKYDKKEIMNILLEEQKRLMMDLKEKEKESKHGHDSDETEFIGLMLAMKDAALLASFISRVDDKLK